ncbi:MAG TPA: hypothetical protein VGF13_02830 [Verrucomicrobiae bacterium]
MMFSELPAEMTTTFVMEFARDRFGRVALLDQVSRRPHSQTLHPLLGGLFEMSQEESLQLPF